MEKIINIPDKWMRVHVVRERERDYLQVQLLMKAAREKKIDRQAWEIIYNDDESEYRWNACVAWVFLGEGGWLVG